MILLGEDTSPDVRRATPLDALVNPSAPPFFLRHTAEDSYVPSEHAYRLAAALAAHDVPHTVHVFAHGPHSLGLARGAGEAAAWTTLAESWIAEQIHTPAGWPASNPAIAATLRDELAPTGITVQTINLGPYETGFNDRMADTTYRWHDDAVNFTREDDGRANFAEIMAGQFDPQGMIDRMVSVIGAEDGTYRNVWPPAIEDLLKQA